MKSLPRSVALLTILAAAGSTLLSQVAPNAHRRANAATVPAPTTAAAPLTASELKTGGGPNGALFTALYTGDFDKTDIDRSSVTFAAVGSGYIEGFSNACREHLPQDAVQLTRNVCDSWWVTRNGYGVELSRTCNSSHQEGTGIYADPQLYAAINSTPIQSVGNAFRLIFETVLKSDNPIAGGLSVGLDAIQVKTDAASLVAENGCTSPALRRFQANVQRFALGEEGLRLDGTVQVGATLVPPPAGERYRDSDYARLLDDMVVEQGKTWAFNRYVPGSIRATNVDSRDSFGRPAKISATYAYNGFSNRQQGTVTLAFSEGRPTCLYFSDQPGVCRTPVHRLISAYVNGSYR